MWTDLVVYEISVHSEVCSGGFKSSTACIIYSTWGCNNKSERELNCKHIIKKKITDHTVASWNNMNNLAHSLHLQNSNGQCFLIHMKTVKRIEKILHLEVWFWKASFSVTQNTVCVCGLEAKIQREKMFSKISICRWKGPKQFTLSNSKQLMNGG